MSSMLGHRIVTEEEEERVPLTVVDVDLESSSENGQSSSSKPPPNDTTANTAPPHAHHGGFAKLLWGAGGIYVAFLYYGSLQEDVFRYESPLDGSKFQSAWFLQFLEASANILVAFVGRQFIAGGTPNLPLRPFLITGATQVSSKAFTSLALASGLSFPVATLAKSGKMAPVMAGQLLIGGATYTLRDYLQVAAIIGGTAVLSAGKKKGGESTSSILGLVFILSSLMMDGVTGGIQKRLKANLAQRGLVAKPYDFMLFTNLSMMLVALLISVLLGDFMRGYLFCLHNPKVWALVLQFSLCSAVGQSFIFYTVAHFDPLVCSTVTTTRKIMSVLISILLKGHSLSLQGWSGVCLAISGILSEVHSKITAARAHRLKSKISM